MSIKTERDDLIKQMNSKLYSKKRFTECLYSDEYKGYKCAIVTIGTHPCAYVECKNTTLRYFDLLKSEVIAKRGVTYTGPGYWGWGSDKLRWIGWAYCYMGDYCEAYPSMFDKKWTLKEIHADIRQVIDVLITLETGEIKSMRVKKRTVNELFEQIKYVIDKEQTKALMEYKSCPKKDKDYNLGKYYSALMIGISIKELFENFVEKEENVDETKHISTSTDN